MSILIICIIYIWLYAVTNGENVNKSIILKDLTLLPNEDCDGCYRDVQRKPFERIISRHFHEVIVSSDLLVENVTDAFIMNNSRAAIIAPNMAITSASYFVHDSNSMKYAIYTNYLTSEENKSFYKHHVNEVIVHPNYIKGNRKHNIAILKIKDVFCLKSIACHRALLPDDTITSLVNQIQHCALLTSRMDSLDGSNDFISLEAQLLSNQECSDLTKLYNLTLLLASNSFCVKVHSTHKDDKKISILMGSTCICDGIVRGIAIENYLDNSIEYPISFTDVGLQTNWIRGKVLNLKYIPRSNCGCRLHFHICLYSILLFLTIVFYQ